MHNNQKKTKSKSRAAFIGTVVEYYDYSLYGFSAAVLAEHFFPQYDNVTSIMQVFAIYAAAYITKPLGSIFFSILGDSYGRVGALKYTILGIGVPTFIIGILPGYHEIGVISTYVLVICRLFQGFFVGGEYDGAAIYIIEHLGTKNKYIASAITRATGVVGLLFGIAITNFFHSSVFPSWAWRIPFLLSLPLALVTIYMRYSLEETPDFSESKQENKDPFGGEKLLLRIKRNLPILFKFVLLSSGFGVTYQVAIIFMQQYLLIVFPASKQIMSSASIAIVFVFGLAMPASGWLVDRIGVKILTYSLITTLISCALLAISIQEQLLNLCIISSLLLAASVAPFNALAHGVTVHALPVHERYKIIALGHSMGSVLMGGPAAYVSLFMMKHLEWTLFPVFYLAIFSIVAFASFKSINTTHNKSKNIL